MVIILCAGALYQWEINRNIVQQFLPIAGTTILRRIVAQVREHGYEPIVVTCRDDIKEHVDTEFFEPESYGNIADTWYNTRSIWKDQTVVLFGDTIYGPITMEQTLKYRGGFRAIGNIAEIFAFTWQESNYAKLAAVLDIQRKVYPGAAWRIYRCYVGYSPHDGRMDKSFRWVWDRTADIDDLMEYREALKIWGK